MGTYFFTSESVTEGHSDKVSDQISDAVLDAILAKDKYGRVASETFVTTGMVLVGGEITTETYVDIPEIGREYFPTRPKDIIDKFDLLRPIYTKTAAYGHFGCPGFPWEQTDLAGELSTLQSEKTQLVNE